MAKTDKKPIITIYTREDCCLCEEAKKVIVNTQEERYFTLKEIDITLDKDLLDQFKEEVPVIFINERKVFKYRIDKEELIEKLDRIISRQ